MPARAWASLRFRSCAGSSCRLPRRAIFGGIRTSAVNVVATATIAPLAGVLTLGDYILSANVYGDEGRLAGAILVALLALAVEFACWPACSASWAPRGVAHSCQRSGRQIRSRQHLRLDRLRAFERDPAGDWPRAERKRARYETQSPRRRPAGGGRDARLHALLLAACGDDDNDKNDQHRRAASDKLIKRATRRTGERSRSRSDRRTSPSSSSLVRSMPRR